MPRLPQLRRRVDPERTFMALGSAEELGLDRLTSEYWALGSAWIHEQRMRRELPS